MFTGCNTHESRPAWPMVVVDENCSSWTSGVARIDIPATRQHSGHTVVAPKPCLEFMVCMGMCMWGKAHLFTASLTTSDGACSGHQFRVHWSARNRFWGGAWWNDQDLSSPDHSAERAKGVLDTKNHVSFCSLDWLYTWGNCGGWVMWMSHSCLSKHLVFQTSSEHTEGRDDAPQLLVQDHFWQFEPFVLGEMLRTTRQAQMRLDAFVFLFFLF